MTHLRQLFITTILLLLQQHAEANFFARLLSYGGTGEADLQPSGARAASGPPASKVGSVVGFDNGILMSHMSNDKRIPLVGLGVGNSPQEYVGALISEALQDDKRTRLIDTSHASYNEDLVAEGIVHGVELIDQTEKVEVHVVTKVWYTHLGYGRTKLSVQESLAALGDAIRHPKVDLRIHVLLHWPKCYSNVEWMDCEAEEEDLDSHVKAAGPDPSLNPDQAWKDSWRYLEEIYMSGEYPIESIGLSNFQLQDVEKMDDFAKIYPHLLQVNLWNLMYDHHLVDYCHKHRIQLQVYNTMHKTMLDADQAPHALHHLYKVANGLSAEAGLEVSAGQTILAWLVQHGISVIPRTSRLVRLEENSGVVLSSIPAMNDEQVELVATAVEAYLSGEDMEKDIHVSVTFHAVNTDIFLYWVNPLTGEESRINPIWKGTTYDDTTYPNHIFRTYNAYNKDIYVDHVIDVNFGEHKDIHVELS